MKHKSRILGILFLTLCSFTGLSNQLPTDSLHNGMDYSFSTVINAGTGDFAPYFIASNNAGVTTQSSGIQERIKGIRKMRTDRRFDYGFGADLIGGYYSSTDYQRFNNTTGQWYENPQHPAYFRIHQLFGEIRFRSCFISAGMKENNRSLFDSPLSSGDITLSNNARPIPQIRAGFLNFIDIPLTNKWLQIRGDIAYGKFVDNAWLSHHVNLYNKFVTTGTYFHYASLHFRTNPQKNLSVTIGMQHAAQFGGTRKTYLNGDLVSVTKDRVKLSTFFRMFIPYHDGSGTTEGDQNYYMGNHLGSWDLKATYKFADGSRINLTWQSPWEDGSGIGKYNAWDGVYGLEYTFANKGYINGVRVEYLDFRNQSGPVHWAVGDHENTGITGAATGSDNYYNNHFYNGWANYGMSLGTPFLKSPIYNTSGNLYFRDNRIYGFHAGINGSPVPGFDYRVLYSWRKSSGQYSEPALKHREDTSMLFEGAYKLPGAKGLGIHLRVAFDTGSLYGNNFGVEAGITYSGTLSF